MSLNQSNNLNNTKAARRISTMLCKVLRHNPEMLNIHLDEEGWTPVEDLIQSVNQNIFFKVEELINADKSLPRHLKEYKKFNVTEFFLQDLKDIYFSDEKNRYMEKENFKFIRCVQGHSHPSVKIRYEKIELEHDIYHGTSPEYLESIMKEGLTPQKRLYVHLSPDIETAKKVGKRHSGKKEPVILVIKKDTPIEFFITPNNVFHATHIPAQFLSVLE